MVGGGSGPNGLKAEAMHQRGAMFAKSFLVIGRRVALIGEQIVLRKDFVPAGENRIAMHFRQYRCGGYGTAAGIAVDQRHLFDGQIESESVDEQEVRRNGKRFDGAAHRQARSLQDVDLVDFKYIGAADTPAQAARFDMPCKSFSLFLQNDLAVAQAADRAVGMEENSRGKDRAEEAAAAYFIHARNARESALAGLPLESADATYRAVPPAAGQALFPLT